MKNLPEGAGSPISRMPQTTKGGLLPTHQLILLIHQPFCLLIAFFRLPKEHNSLRCSADILPALFYQFASFFCIFSGSSKSAVTTMFWVLGPSLTSSIKPFSTRNCFAVRLTFWCLGWRLGGRRFSAEGF
jgi:hypothetical protein